MADDLHTIGIQVEADSTQAAKLTRALQDLGRVMEMTAQQQQRLRTNMQQSQQQMQASGGAAGYMMGQMKALAAQMLAFVGVVALVNKGIHEFADSLAQAARLEEESDNFVDLADNAKNAQKALQDILTWWRGAGGIFDQKDIMAAANALAALHVKADAIPTILMKLGDAAETSGGKLSDWVSTIGTFLAGRFIGQGTTEMKLLLNEVALAAGQSTEKIKQVLAKAKPDEIIAFLEKGLSRLGTVSSKTFEQAADAATRYDGQLRILDARWTNLKQQFGTPIIDALTPLIEKWNKELAGGGSAAHNFGQSVADGITSAAKTIEDQMRQTGDTTQAILKIAFKLLFQWLVIETKTVWTFLFYTLPVAAWQTFDGWMRSFGKVTWTDIGDAIVAVWDTVWERIKAGATAMMDWFSTHIKFSPFGIPSFQAGPPTPAAPNQFLTGQQPATPGLPLGLQPTTPFNMTAGAVAGAAGAQGDVTGSLANVQAGIRNLNDTDKAVKELTGDAKVLTEFWQDYTEAFQQSTTPTALQAKQLEAISKAAKGLVDPMAHINELTKGMAPDTAAIGNWILYEEAATRAIAVTELRMKSGVATMSESLTQGLKLMSRSWGTWQQQVSNGIQEIGNSLVSNISGGLKEILNGTKSVSEGFRDMAVAVISAIEDIILKMLIQLAIQQLISAFVGGPAGGYITSIPGAGVQPVRFATRAQRGGAVGGQGDGDTVPIMAEPGEFVVRRDAARKIGYDRLERMNKMQGGGRVHGYEFGGRITYYGPGFTNDPNYDSNSAVGRGNSPETGGRWSLIPYYDVAMSPADALKWFGLQPAYDANGNPIASGGTFQYHGQTWRWGDTGPPGGVMDIYTYNKKDLNRTGKAPYWGAGRPPDRHYGDTGFRHIESELIRQNNLPEGGGPILDPSQFGPNRFTAGPGFPQGPSITEAFGPNVPTYYDPVTGQVDPTSVSGAAPMYPYTVPSQDPAHAGQYVITSGSRAGQYVDRPIAGPSGFRDLVTGGGGGFIERAFSSPGYSSPSYLSSMGYVAGGGTGSLWKEGGASAGQQHGATAIAGAFTNLGGMGTTANISALSGWAAHNLAVFSKFGYLAPTRALVGGPPPGMLRGTMAGGYRGNIVNTAFGGGDLERGIRPGQQGRSRQATFHEGGIVDTWAAYQSGGMVQAGEGVFTPQQMSRLAPVTNNQSNVQIGINVNDNRTTVEGEAQGSGLNQKDAADMARMVAQMVDTRIARQKRAGGSLYQPRAG